MTTPVSMTFEVDYPVRQVVATTGPQVQYGVRSVISSSSSIVYGVRRIISPAKVFSLKHAVRERTSKSSSVQYGVRVSIISNGGSFSSAFSNSFSSVAGGGSPGKDVDVVYGVRSRVTETASVYYDTAATVSVSVSKPFSVSYHTLIKPVLDEVITTPAEVDKVPPQIVTSSF